MTKGTCKCRRSNLYTSTCQTRPHVCAYPPPHMRSSYLYKPTPHMCPCTKLCKPAPPMHSTSALSPLKPTYIMLCLQDSKTFECKPRDHMRPREEMKEMIKCKIRPAKDESILNKPKSNLRTLKIRPKIGRNPKNQSRFNLI